MNSAKELVENRLLEIASPFNYKNDDGERMTDESVKVIKKFFDSLDDIFDTPEGNDVYMFAALGRAVSHQMRRNKGRELGTQYVEMFIRGLMS